MERFLVPEGTPKISEKTLVLGFYFRKQLYFRETSVGIKNKDNLIVNL